MARRIPLKIVPMALDGLAPQGVPRQLDYGETMRAILKLPSPGRGLSLDEVVAAIGALAPVEQAMTDSADFVTLSEEQYRTLREKLDLFAFSLADQAIVDFGLAIRNAPEIT